MTSKLFVDPFRRVHQRRGSALVLIEFCAVIGPKIVIRVSPEDTHYDFDKIALWIMSTHNDIGTVVTLFNQQEGLYAVAYFSSLIDITARGLQRLFALAYITDEPINETVFELFTCYKDRTLQSLFACNHQLFTNLSERVIEAGSWIDHKAFQQYYALYSEELSSENEQKLSGLADRIRPLKLRITSSMPALYNNMANACMCGSEIEDFTLLLPHIGKASSSDFMPFFSLCPCAISQFDASFNEMYTKLTTDSEAFGYLYCSKIPIVSEFLIKKTISYDMLNFNAKHSIDRKNLVSMQRVFSQLMFMLLTSQKIVVFGSADREQTITDVLNKLVLVAPYKQLKGFKVLSDSAVNCDALQDQFTGIIISRDKSPDLMVRTARQARIDLNYQRILSRPYKGSFLKPFNRMAFPSDESLIAFVAYHLTYICRWAIEVDKTSFEAVCRKGKLSPDDKEILINLLVNMNIEKHGHLLQPVEKSTFSVFKF